MRRHMIAAAVACIGLVVGFAATPAFASPPPSTVSISCVAGGDTSVSWPPQMHVVSVHLSWLSGSVQDGSVTGRPRGFTFSAPTPSGATNVAVTLHPRTGIGVEYPNNHCS
jgi:hypothetical protein